VKVTGLFLNSDETRAYASGDVIFTEDEGGEEMFGIVEGAVDLTVRGRTIAALGPDDVFGEMALIDQSTRSATATATADTKVAVISQRHFLFLVHETPTFALQVMSSMAERLRAST
jgi:CRP-like cAMP-binding protein